MEFCFDKINGDFLLHLLLEYLRRHSDRNNDQTWCTYLQTNIG